MKEILQILRNTRDKCIVWAMDLYQRRGGGWPGVTEGDDIGIWVTGQFLRAIIEANTVNATQLTLAVETLLSKQTSSGGWPLVSGDQPAVISTSEIITSLSKFHALSPEYESNKLRQAIDDAIKWLLVVQNSRDGGWGLEGALAKTSSGECRTSCTAHALLALHRADPNRYSVQTQRGIDFLRHTRTERGWPDVQDGPVTPNATLQAVAAILALHREFFSPLEVPQLCEQFMQQTPDRLATQAAVSANADR